MAREIDDWKFVQWLPRMVLSGVTVGALPSHEKSIAIANLLESPVLAQTKAVGSCSGRTSEQFSITA
jgi:hypothetical protein